MQGLEGALIKDVNALNSQIGDTGSKGNTAPPITPVPSLALHPFCKLIPPHTEKEANELLADIRKNKLQVPIRIYRGQILDGRGRYDACLKLFNEGVETGFKTETFAGTDEEARSYVISTNVKRRHLSTSQRAIIAARLVTTKNGGDRQSAKLLTEITQEAAAELLNVSTRLVTDAVKILPNEDLVKEVLDGKKAVSAAAKEFDEKKAGPVAPATEEDENQSDDTSDDTDEPTNPIALINTTVADLIDAVSVLNADDAKAVIDRLFQQLRLIATAKGVTLAEEAT